MTTIRLDDASVADMLEVVAILEQHGIKVAEIQRVPGEDAPDGD